MGCTFGCNFGAKWGIGEGVLRRRAGVLCSSVPVLCRFCAATNGLITPFISQLQRKHSIFIKRYFKIVYIKRVRKVLCFRCFRCSCTLIGLYLPCTACAPHRARSSFFLNKGKGIGSPRPLSGAEGSTSPHLPRRPMGESFWGERRAPPLGGR